MGIDGRALDRISVPRPGRFTHELTFRRCLQCGSATEK